MDKIIFINMPENLLHSINSFKINPKIQFPVESDERTGKGDFSGISIERIIAAMLKILAFQEDFEYADYYREFITTVKPELSAQLIDAGVEKAKNKEFAIAEDIFLAVNALEPNNITNLINIALLYEHKASVLPETDKENIAKYLDKAFTLYKKALAVDSSSIDVQYYTGNFFLNRRNYEKAKEHFQIFLDLVDDLENEIYAGQKEIVLKMIREIDARDLLDANFKQAYDFIQLGKEEEGINIISQFLKKSPETWNAWFLLGWGNRRLGKWEEGYNAFKKVIELGEKSVDTLNEIALCSIGLGKTKEAEKYLIDALKLEPENVKIISNLGIMHYKNGEIEKAKSFFLSSLEYDADDLISRKYLDIIENS
jgi:tetratricopeptide (TPR) repeat protein